MLTNLLIGGKIIYIRLMLKRWEMSKQKKLCLAKFIVSLIICAISVFLLVYAIYGTISVFHAKEGSGLAFFIIIPVFWFAFVYLCLSFWGIIKYKKQSSRNEFKPSISAIILGVLFLGCFIVPGVVYLICEIVQRIRLK